MSNPPSTTSPTPTPTPSEADIRNRGQAALARLSDALNAVTEPQHPRTPLEDASATALRVSDAITKNEARAALFAKMPEDFLDPIHLARLEDLGEAGRYIARQLKDARALDGSHVRRLPADLSKDAQDTRSRMALVLTYHVGHDPEASARLTSLREDRSYKDLASDLERLADLYQDYEAELINDTRHYRPSDEALARSLASRIIRELDTERRARVEHWSALQSKLWPLLSSSYANVQATALFIWRNDPPSLSLFPTLHHSTRSKHDKSAITQNNNNISPPNNTTPES